MDRNDQDFLVKKIRTQYMEKEVTSQEAGLMKLQELDQEVRRPANIFAYVFGTISALIMGSGMSIIMTDIGARLGKSAMPIGIGVGLVGLLMAIVNYPIYKKILGSRQKKYADQIIQLSDELLK